MAVNPISANTINLLSTDAVSAVKSALDNANVSGGFADIFTEAMNTVSATDTVDKSSTVALLSGESDNMVGMMVDSQKAEISLNLALAMRNKVLDAYSEIMRMQV